MIQLSKVHVQQNKKPTRKGFYMVIILLSICINTYSQPNKRTNQWFFSTNIGLDFSSGSPIENTACPISPMGFGGTSTICDTSGILLFYSTGKQVWNREHQEMVNGNAGNGYSPGTQAALCLPKPGSDSLYYIFTSRFYQEDNPMFYYIINMNGNNGLGEVIDKDTLSAGWDAAEQLTASYLKNKEDYWVITRKYREHKYAAFNVTSQGVDNEPVLSDAPNRYEAMGTHNSGYMKISYDKKYIASCFRGEVVEEAGVEICKFNNETGEVDFLYSFRLEDIIANNPKYRTNNCEFSPCSKYMYLAGSLRHDTISHIYQFDMQYIEDPMLFKQSAIKIGEPQGANIQLASDGKIYCFAKSVWNATPFNNLIGIIHKPEKLGAECNYQPNAILLNHGQVLLPFVNFAPDFLYRFDYDGICESDTFSFDPWFFPEPLSIQWNFGDPASGTNNTSFTPHATHVFTDGGTYEVSVYVVYPNGRIEETSREVEVEYAPEPDLGPDVTVCSNQDIILNAECGAHNYLWSTNQFGTSQITVSDTGWYWVRVSSDEGCFAYDSIHISKYAPALADTSSLIISPTTCGGSTGAIRNLAIIGTPQYNYQWVDDLGNPIATTIDLYQLPVGNYTLQVTDGNNCTIEFGPYSILDAGEVLVESVIYAIEHCDQQNGSITVTATSGLGDMLYYSIDNGASYIQNLGKFTGLSSGSYAVRVHDSTMCEDAYINNPIIIENIQGPQVTDVQVIPATVGQSDGSIFITVTSSGDTLHYSNDDSASFQINDGLFTNLQAGYYTCWVVDEFGCDTTFIIEVTENFTERLEAVAGDDEVCPGISAYVPLSVSNFNDVTSFTTTLLYDEEALTCQGFANAHTLLEDSLKVYLFPAEGKIELEWASTSVTLPENANIADLVFQTTNPGGSQIEWDGTPGASLFTNSTGLTIPVDYTIGEVKIYKEVYFTLSSITEVCQGEIVYLQPNMWSSNGTVTYLWTYPDGTTTEQEYILIEDAEVNQTGTYSLLVTDTVDCKLDATVDVFIYPIPISELAFQDTVFAEDPIDLDAGTGFSHYWWNTGDTTQMIWVENEGWYIAEVESQKGCVGEDSTFVFFSSPPMLIKLYFPNAFTPNGDGQNDMFNVVSSILDVNQFSLSIYNRWGAQMYHTNDIIKGWDGTYQGKLCPSGAYVYKVSYNSSTSLNSAPEIKSGTVMLVR